MQTGWQSAAKATLLLRYLIAALPQVLHRKS